MFPPDTAPERLRLAGAAQAGWAIGGMGWWNDRYFPDPNVEQAFQELTFDYYEALAGALVAACAS